MGLVTTAHSMSLDGFIADADYRGDRTFRRGSRLATPQADCIPPSRCHPRAPSSSTRESADAGPLSLGGATYDVSDAWGGKGPFAVRGDMIRRL
jgi:hypothetical protein